MDSATELHQSLDLSSLLSAATAAAVRAGSHLTSIQGAIEQGWIESKSTAVDLVSTADREAEDIIRQALSQYAEIGFIGEESPLPDPGAFNHFWCVDPLDGTSNFLCGLPLWCVSIALITPDYYPLLGVVHAPLLGKTWSAARGAGAYCNGTAISVRTKPPGGGLSNSMLATGFPYDVTTAQTDTNIDLYVVMQGKFQKIRRLGSAAIDMAYVADGTFDGMWELKLKPWDSAAGVVLIEEAGGQLRQLSGKTYTPGDLSLVAASTPELLERILGLIGS